MSYEYPRAQSPQNPDDRTTRRRSVSRRLFLGGVGTGAAAGVATTLGLSVAADNTPAAAAGAPSSFAAPGYGEQQHPVPATRSDRFGRLFPDLPPFARADDRSRAAMRDIGKPGGLMDAQDNLAVGPIKLITDPAQSTVNRDNPTHTAGTTFLGQFLDHDLTFDPTSRLGVPAVPEQSPNARTPAFDLDSVYGAGPVVSPVLYEADHVRLRIESGGRFEDLPRNADGTAILAEPRNDENLMVSGLTAAFILFHNRVASRLHRQGVPPSQLLARARQVVTWHYQWIIVHEYLPQILGAPMVRDILAHGRKWYRPAAGEAFIPVEFQGAAYRFGHSMVRPSYRANLAGNADGTPFFGFVFDPAGEGQADPVDLRGGHRARRRFVGWQTFFDFGDGQVKRNKRIDTKISTPLFTLPLGAIATGDHPTALPQRNLLRQLTWSMPAGQDIARQLGEQQLVLPELAKYGLGLERRTPLWYYVLAEAEKLADGLTLGPVGGRIVGEVFVGLLQLDPGSYLHAQPGWRPTLPGRVRGDFRMTDLLRFAQVDPASRGQ